MKTALIVLVLASVFISGCSKTVTWKEEVQLSDGRIIAIERETFTAQGGGNLSGPGYHPDKRYLRVEYPLGSGRRVEWMSTKRSSEYFIPEKPLVLDIEGDALVIYSIVALEAGCRAYSKYTYRDGHWSEKTLPEEFPEHLTNLMLRDAVEMPAFVSVEDTRRNNQDIGYSQLLKKVGPHRITCRR